MFLCNTSSHVIEPKHIGIAENTVQLSDALRDTEIFMQRAEILPLFYQKDKNYEQCSRFLSAAGSILGDTYRLVLDMTDTSKIYNFVNRIVAKEMKRKSYTRGHEQVRFLSAFTGDGHIFFDRTVKTLCNNIYLLEDEFGASSKLILCNIRSYALELGYDVVSCYCPLAPFDRLEHLIIPELSLGFITSNSYHKPMINPDRVVSYRRFTSLDELRNIKRRIAFNKKATLQLLSEAENLLHEASIIHSNLESYYSLATDYSVVDTKTNILISQIEKIYSLK